MDGGGNPCLGPGVKSEDLGPLIPGEDEEMIGATGLVPKRESALNIIQNPLQIPRSLGLAVPWLFIFLKNAVVVEARGVVRDQIKVGEVGISNFGFGEGVVNEEGRQELLRVVHGTPKAEIDLREI